MSETTTVTLTDFLLARITEDEETSLSGQHGKPDRIAREAEAKRRIVEYRISEGFADDGMVTALRALAAIYADHPDYRDEWRP